MEDLMYCNSDGNFYFASQPHIHTYTQLKEKGINCVINLRAAGEGDFSEHAQKCVELGIKYIQCSFIGPAGIDPDTISKVNDFIKANEGEKFLVHCASANRTGGWYAIYLNQVCGVELEDAIDKAFDTNNMRPPMDDMVRDFLE